MHLLMDKSWSVKKTGPTISSLGRKWWTFFKRKNFRNKMKIPVMSPCQQHELKGHERLSCVSCNASRAPQCYGCHIEYDPQETQWDNLKQKRIPGRWIEKSWAVESGISALGVTSKNRITPFVPGMNLILKTSPESASVRKQNFASLSLHTSQLKVRSYVSCHRNDAALGIIHDQAYFPEYPEWSVPLGWISENAKQPGKSAKKGDRSFNISEIAKIRSVGACLKRHLQEDNVFVDFQMSLQDLPRDHAEY